ncbi:MAG: sensor histidine kinase N-terminal domain-containing protein [Candidatus Obscuribacterales bacterium]
MAESSIRKQLLTYLLIPLCSLVVLGTLVAYGIAYTVANYTYDRALLNSADALAGRLRWKSRGVVVDMPPAAQAILRYSGEDKVYYQVLNQDQGRISGDAVIPGPVRDPLSNEPGFRDASLNGVKIRVARLRCLNPNQPEDAVLVQVAETLEGRNNLTRMLTFSIVAPQISLIVLGSLAVWLGIGRGLRPLSNIQQAVTERNPQDLSPLVFDAVPTEVKPLVQSINDLLEQLRSDLETQRRFVANAAHQLRTPLAGLRTYTGLAQRLSKDEKTNTLIEHIDQGIDRMVRLVDRLLCLARVEPSSETLHSLVDLNFIASDSAAELIETAVAKDIDLTFQAASKPALVLGDKEALRYLASNLIENAVLYTQKGGTVSVSVSNGNGIRLSVEDDGPGISHEERKRVFERFYRVLGTDVGGSGLGLAIVREIALTHKAKVSLTDGSNGQGTLVSVSFESQPKL